jgi:hypothetical protein
MVMPDEFRVFPVSAAEAEQQERLGKVIEQLTPTDSSIAPWEDEPEQVVWDEVANKSPESGDKVATGEARVTVLPPGVAVGAHDLRERAGRRLANQSGVYVPKKKNKKDRPRFMSKKHRRKLREAAQQRAGYQARVDANVQAYQRAEPRLIKRT